MGTFAPFGAATLTINAIPTGDTTGNFTFGFTFGDGDNLVAAGMGTIDNATVSGTANVETGSGTFLNVTGTLTWTIVVDVNDDPNPFLFTATGNLTLTARPDVPANLMPTSGVSCSDPVNVNNGNMHQSHVDLAARSRGPALAVVRSYNSLLASADSPFGFGWTHNYDMSLTDAGTAVTLIDQSGAAWAFKLQGTSYISPPGLSLTLTKNPQGYAMRGAYGAVWSFDTGGVLQSITDRNQNALTLTHDSSGRLSMVTDALSRTLTFSYDDNGHITQLKDFSGRQVVYSYDSSGDLISYTDAAGNTTKYEYYQTSAQQHLIETITKPAGNFTSFQYGAGGQVSSLSDSAGRNMSFQYIPASNQTVFNNPRGFAATFTYDSLGNITRTLNADGSHADTTYTPDARVASHTDENGNTIQFTYDSQGNPLSITDALGATTRLTYEPIFNQVTSITDPRGAVSAFTYDPQGNLTTISLPMRATLHFTYDVYGDLLTATDGEGNTRTLTYDSSGNPVKMVDPLGNATQFQFDNLRRLSGVTDAANATISLQWDVLDRLIRSVNPLGNSVARSFDSNGNLSQFTDSNNHVTNYSYDALDNLSTVTDPTGGTVEYGYAVSGCGCSTDSDLTSFRDGAGVSHQQTYDYAERLTQSVDSAGNQIGFSYSARGDLTGETTPDGATIEYQYDPNGRLVRKIFPDGTDARFVYDANGNLTGATNANTTITFSYDDLNRITRTADSRFAAQPLDPRSRNRRSTGVIGYRYDRSGRRLALIEPGGGAIRYRYDADGRLTSIVNPAGAAVSFTYDALNRPTVLQYSNGVMAAWQYDAANEVTSIAYSSPHTSVARFGYTYDKNGNPSTATDSATHAYQFDAVNRVTGATNPSESGESYSYDGAGNRIASATDSRYTYDTAGRLIAAEGATYVYDKAGNLIKRTDSTGTTSYSYDFENRLTRITFPSGVWAAYLYDALGRRIQKTVNGVVTKYLYDGANIFLEMDQNGHVLARYTHGIGVDQPLMMERGGNTYFYLPDKLGSIAALTDAAGSVACSYSYTTFGSTQPCKVTNPYGFAGREYDSESGLIYMRARYYDPATGRFLTADPLNLTGLLLVQQHGGTSLHYRRTPQQLNEYSYAINNPVTFRDPTGLKCMPLQGPIQLEPLYGSNGLLFIGPSLQYPALFIVMDQYGDPIAQAATVTIDSRQVSFYDIGGNLISELSLPGDGDLDRTAPLEQLNQDGDISSFNTALNVADQATYAELYNFLLAYLDPLGNNPRAVDPLAQPSGPSVN